MSRRRVALNPWTSAETGLRSLADRVVVRFDSDNEQTRRVGVLVNKRGRVVTVQDPSGSWGSGLWGDGTPGVPLYLRRQAERSLFATSGETPEGRVRWRHAKELYYDAPILEQREAGYRRAPRILPLPKRLMRANPAPTLDYEINDRGDLVFHFTGDPDDLDIRDVADLLEATGLLGRGWDLVDPEDVGALTSAPIITDDLECEDDGTCSLGPDARLWWYPDYAIRDPIEELLDTGRVVFPNAEERELIWGRR